MPSFIVLTCFGTQSRQNQASFLRMGRHEGLTLSLNLADQEQEGVLGSRECWCRYEYGYESAHFRSDPSKLCRMKELVGGVVSSHGIEQAVADCLQTSSSGKWLAGSVPDSLSALCVENGYDLKHHRRRGLACRPSRPHRAVHRSSGWQ